MEMMIFTIFLKIFGVKVHDGLDDEDFTQIALAFDQTVAITESFYPKLSMTNIISDLGGSLGFWLGLGAVQLCLNVLNYLPRLICKSIIIGPMYIILRKGS